MVLITERPIPNVSIESIFDGTCRRILYTRAKRCLLESAIWSSLVSKSSEDCYNAIARRISMCHHKWTSPDDIVTEYTVARRVCCFAGRPTWKLRAQTNKLNFAPCDFFRPLRTCTQANNDIRVPQDYYNFTSTVDSDPSPSIRSSTLQRPRKSTLNDARQECQTSRPQPSSRASGCPLINMSPDVCNETELTQTPAAPSLCQSSSPPAPASPS